jgi:riboflavin-specific deaminase-like protein
MDGTTLTPDSTPDWEAMLALRDAPGRPPAGPLGALFAPLLSPPRAADGCTVVGRLAQTLDGRIATLSGSSQWIGGRGDLLHTHRLRALCHAVVVGAGTVRSDDPRLTTRDCPGPHPVRVVLDTDRRLGPDYGVFRAGPPTLLLCAADAPGADASRRDSTDPESPDVEHHHVERLGIAEVLRLPRDAVVGGLQIPAILATLAARGLTRIFVEGGGVTVSRFLAAGCLDRLHVTVAPVLLGSGIPAFTLPEAARIADGLRFDWTVHSLDPDVLFDIALDRARPGVCG